MNIHLSIIIPAYNESRNLRNTIPRLVAFLVEQPYTWEILVVENGSNDDTMGVAMEFAGVHPEIHVFREQRRGKGLAVRRGMLEAKGEILFLCDADLCMSIEDLPRFLDAMQHVDIVIGSREAEGAHVHNAPVWRQYIGRFFNRMVRWAILPGLRDTQCGFKAFSAAAAWDIFRRCQIDGMAFDVEALYLANRCGYRIVELGITLHIGPDSRVRIVRDGWEMTWDILRIRYLHG